MITRVLPVPASAAATAIAAVSGSVAAAAGRRAAQAQATRLARRGGADRRDRSSRTWCATATSGRDRHPRRRCWRMLITARSRFTAKADPHSRWFALRVGPAVRSPSRSCTAWSMLYTYSDHVVGHPSFWRRLLRGRSRRWSAAAGGSRSRGERVRRRVARHAVRVRADARSSSSRCSRCARPSRSRDCPTSDEHAAARPARPARRARLARLLRTAPGQVGGVVGHAARPRSPTGSCSASRWPAATRSVIRRHGRARSRRTATWSRSTAGRRR